MQQNHDEMAEKYISAVETYTMQDLADYINAADEWPADVEDIIERNGWVSDCGTKFGVCHNDREKVIINYEGKAVAVLSRTSKNAK